MVYKVERWRMILKKYILTKKSISDTLLYYKEPYVIYVSKIFCNIIIRKKKGIGVFPIPLNF